MIGGGVPRREVLWAWILAAALALAYSIVALFKHWHFDSSYDLAIFNQAVWHLSRFEVPASTLSGHSNILGDHFYPIITLWALPYWLVPKPETLIIAQAVVLAVSVVPVWAFLRRRLDATPAMCLTVAYGVFWGIQRTAMSDVHELAFAPVLIATAILAIDVRAWRWFWIATALLLLVKEDMIPLVAGFGLYLTWIGERRRGLVVFLGAIAVFILVVRVVIPSFNDYSQWSAGGAFQTVLHEPWRAPLLLFSPTVKLRTVALWLAPFLFLSLGSRWSILLLPIAAERLLSDVPGHWFASGHYSAPLAPILAMSAGDGLSAFGRRLANPLTRRRVVTGLTVTAMLFCAVLPGRQALWRLVSARHYQPHPDRALFAEATALIPADASVVAQTPLAPWLSRRRDVHILQDRAPDADFIIAAYGLDPWPVGGREGVRALIEDRRQRGYMTLFEEGEWVVLKRPSIRRP